jgi:hypothetical protein
MTKYQSDKMKLNDSFEKVADLLVKTKNKSVQYALVLYLLLLSRQSGWLWREGRESLMILGKHVGERLIPLFERLWKEGEAETVYAYINTALKTEYYKMKAAEIDNKVIKEFLLLNPTQLTLT